MCLCAHSINLPIKLYTENADRVISCKYSRLVAYMIAQSAVTPKFGGVVRFLLKMLVHKL
jgi:hypothetical protein